MGEKMILIATSNASKVREMERAFEGLPVRLVPLSRLHEVLPDVGEIEEPVEDGVTFLENARIKAHYYREKTGLAAFADDSGLSVDVLDGAPGVYSARYAGVHGDDAANNAKVLAGLEDVADDARTARFACALVFIDEDGTRTDAMGFIKGRIGHELRGSEGFGYDPLFLPDAFGQKKTLAEVGQDEKNAISHRGNALRALKAKLQTGLQ